MPAAAILVLAALALIAGHAAAAKLATPKAADMDKNISPRLASAVAKAYVEEHDQSRRAAFSFALKVGGYPKAAALMAKGVPL